MTSRFTARQKQIMEKVFAERNPVKWIAAVENETLTFDEIEAACDLLNAEFNMEGLKDNFEPNEYGIEVEAVLDIVNRPRLK